MKIAEVAVRIAEVYASGFMHRMHLEREAISDHRFFAFTDRFHEEAEVVQRVGFAFHCRFWRRNYAVEKGRGFVAVCWFDRSALDANADIEKHVGVFGGVF